MPKCGACGKEFPDRRSLKPARSASGRWFARCAACAAENRDILPPAVDSPSSAPPSPFSEKSNPVSAPPPQPDVSRDHDRQAPEKKTPHRRSYRRLRVNMEGEIHFAGHTLATRILDLSEGGAKLVCCEELKEGTLLSLTIYPAPPGSGKPPIHQMLKVAWIRPLESGGIALGGQFIRE